MGNDEFKIFFDEEFTGLIRTTTPISLGMISEDGKTFYAEFNDYNTFQVDDWIRANVIEKLKFNNKLGFYCNNDINKFEVFGNIMAIRYQLLNWLKQFKDKNIQFYADVCHYDFVLLIDILAGSALELPSNISASCHDINQDIANYYNISDKDAFDKSREEIISDIKLPENKHNSLYDAIVAKEIYNKIKPLSKS